MAKIINLFDVVPVKGMFGLEHEVEGRGLTMVLNERWLTKHDGSLRGNYPDAAAEFVLAQPLNLNEAVAAVQWLNKYQKERGGEYRFSYRTSTHVHLNVQQMDEVQLLALAMTYYLLEPAIIHLCGDVRVNNRFCLRMIDADEISELFRNIIVKGLKHLNDVAEGEIKYSALNFASLRRFGSVEFRSLGGTLDPHLVEAWLTLIKRIYDYSQKKTLVKVYNEAVEGGYKKFVTAVIGDMIEYLPADSEDNFNHTLSITMDFPHLYKHYRKENKNA